MEDEEVAMEGTSDAASICTQVQRLVCMPTDPDASDAPTPNKAFVDKAVASVWRVRVRPFRIALMQYLNSLENIKGLTESESLESQAAI